MLNASIAIGAASAVLLRSPDVANLETAAKSYHSDWPFRYSRSVLTGQLFPHRRHVTISSPLSIRQVDVYSFGVVMWELWERRRPFEELRNRFDIADTVAAGGRPPIGRGCPPPYADLIRRCWHQDPTKRPFFQDVVEDLEAEIEAAQAVTEL
ncbi:unnamed protein product [Ectocarpus sp. 12 AP-2014]